MNLMKRRTASLALAVIAALGGQAAMAQQVITLRLHHFLPPQATIPAGALLPWAKQVEAQSGGRLKIQFFPAMQLGGAPPALFDQARDGVADITWTVLGYTPGRFNKSEVFELPFLLGNAESSSKAFQAYVEQYAADEFKDVKLLAVHTHGPGLFHTKAPVNGLESLRGMKIRGGSRIINNMLAKLGATPVGMPVPGVPEALAKGVIDGTTIPWEITPALKVNELVKNHTSFAGNKGLYSQTFAFSMNRRAYDRLPPDLQRVIDNNSGLSTAAMMGRAMDQGDRLGMAQAQKAGNLIVSLDAAETQRWYRTASSVESDWVAEMRPKGIDGVKLLAAARRLIAEHAE